MFPELFRDDVFMIETARLWLRWPKTIDVPAIEQFSRLEAVATMTSSFPYPQPPGFVAERVQRIRSANGTTTLSLVLAEKRHPQRAIGLIGGQFDAAAESMTLGLGYMLAPAHWGKGLMSEAIKGLTAMVYQTTATERVEAGVFPVNRRSKATLERCGFVPAGRVAIDAPARGGLIAVDRFVLSRAGWRASRYGGATPGVRPAGKPATAAKSVALTA
jgi:RimJ/RimL family protein N-acetyltransferase